MVKTQEITALTYSEVDRKTDLLAATVQAAQAPAVTAKIDSVLFYNPATQSYGTTPPTITIGQQFGVAVYGKNTSSGYLHMYAVITAKAPDGSTSTQTTEILTVAAGYSAQWLASWTANAVGNHTVTIVLYAEAA